MQLCYCTQAGAYRDGRTQRPHLLFRKDRTDQFGGGVCVFVANDLIAKVIELPPELAHLELLCLDLLVCEAKYRVVCCYRPPYMLRTMPLT